MPKGRFFQDPQNDSVIKKKLITLLREKVKDTDAPLKVSGTTEGNAKSFDEVEKKFNDYLLYLDELLSLQTPDNPEGVETTKFNKLSTKLSQTAFSLKKSLKSLNPKTITSGEFEELSTYISKLQEVDEPIKNFFESINGSYLKNLATRYGKIVDDNNEIFSIYNVINTRADISVGTVFFPPPEKIYSTLDQMNGGALLPRRFL